VPSVPVGRTTGRAQGRNCRCSRSRCSGCSRGLRSAGKVVQGPPDQSDRRRLALQMRRLTE
jgi:hypothetical protein